MVKNSGALGEYDGGSGSTITFNIPSCEVDDKIVLFQGVDWSFPSGAGNPLPNVTTTGITWTPRTIQYPDTNDRAFSVAWTGVVTTAGTRSVTVASGSRDATVNGNWYHLDDEWTFHAAATTNTQPAASSYPAPSIASCEPDDELFAAWQSEYQLPEAFTPPGGMTDIHTTTGGDGWQTSARRTLASSGASGTTTATRSGSAPWCACTVVMRPTDTAATITGVASAPLGAIAATATGTPATPGTAAAPLGAVTATAAGVVSSVSATAPLGALDVTATGVRATTAADATADLGALTAAADGVRATTGTATAPLGGITATALASSVSYLGASGLALNPQVWLVDADDLDVLSPLRHWEALDLSPIANSPGSCQLIHPAGAPGFADLFTGVSANPQSDVEIEVWLAGSSETRSRWILQQKSGDELRVGDLWTFTGAGLEVLLAEVLVGPQETETQELIFGGDTYGTILITALQQAQERDGVLEGMTWDFTTTTDSNGVPWVNTIADLKFAPDDTLLAVAEIGPAEAIGEFAVGPDRVLSAWNAGTRGTDRSTGSNPLRLAAGANLDEAARRESSKVGDAATAALGKGADGQYQWATDATAQAQRRRRVETPVDVGKIATAGGVLAATQGRLGLLAEGVSERTHGVVFGPGLPIPGVDYDVADWGLSMVGNQATAQRITQWTLKFRRGERGRGTVRTNTLIEDQLVRLSKRLDGVQRGGSVVGTSVAAPDVDDGKAPAQVLGLAASSAAYTGADGVTLASVTAAWTAVTTNADTTAADDIDRYRPQWRFTDSPLPTGWKALGEVATNGLDFDGVLPVESIEIRVAAVDKFGNVGAWSDAYELVTAGDDDAPPVPSTPTVDNYLGILRIASDGLGSEGEPMPVDYERSEVLASQVNDFDLEDEHLVVAEMVGESVTAWSPAGSLGGADYGTTWYIKMRSRDRSGNWSDLSAQASAVPGEIEDGDVATLNVGKLTSGIMEAIVSIAGEFRTADPPDGRVVINSSGIRKYDDDNELRVEVTDDVTRIDGEITVSDAGSASAITIGVGGASSRANVQAFDEVGDLTVVVGQTYDAVTNVPVNNGLLVTRDDPLRNLFRAYGSGGVVGVRVNRPDNASETGTTAFQVIEGESDLLRMIAENGTAAYVGPVGDNEGILVYDTDGSTQRFHVTRVLFNFLLAGSGAQPRIRVAADYAHIGLFDGSARWGFEFIDRARIRSNTRPDITNADGSSFNDLELRSLYYTGSLIETSSAAAKEDFREAPSALDVLRGAPSALWRRLGSDADEMGPVAEDLPEWMRQTFAQPDDDPDAEPRAEGINLSSKTGLLWEAVRELDAELDEMRAQLGRPVPARRKVADLLGDLAAGRIQSATRRARPARAEPPPVDDGPVTPEPAADNDPPIARPPRPARGRRDTSGQEPDTGPPPRRPAR